MKNRILLILLVSMLALSMSLVACTAGPTSVSAVSDTDASPTHRDTSNDEITTTQAQADIPPPLPCYFQGTVSSLNPAGPVPEGVMVDAFVDGVKKAETAVTAQSTYELPVPGEYGDDGKTVTFTVGGVQASQTATWMSAEIDYNFDLTIDSLPGPTVTWDFPSTSDVFFAPTPANNRPYLEAAVSLPTGSEPAELNGVYWLDDATGDWQFFVPGMVTSTLSSLEPGEAYLVAVSGGCSWNLPCGEGVAGPTGSIWEFGSTSDVFFAPTPANNRPYLEAAVSLPTGSEPAELNGVYWLDDATGDWRFFVPGMVTSTLSSLEPGEAYLVAVSAPCSLTIPQEPTPIIENLIVTAKGHIYLRKSTAGGDYDVWKAEEYGIECIASGTGELAYNWSCDGGEISGEGSTITWTAPNKTSVRVTVTVILSDVTGNSVVKNIVFTVPSCSCGSWG